MAIKSNTDGHLSNAYDYVIDLDKIAEYKTDFDEKANYIKTPIDNFIRDVDNNVFNTFGIKGLNEVRDHIKSVVTNIKNINENISGAMEQYSNEVETTEGEISGKIAGLSEFTASSDGQWEIIDNAVKPVLDGDLDYNTWLAIKNSPTSFFNIYNGKVGLDEHIVLSNGTRLGPQCVAGFKCFLKYYGIPIVHAPDNVALGYWNKRDTEASSLKNYGTFIPMSEIDKYGGLQNGDWMFMTSNVSSAGHVSMYFNGMQFGQNQNGQSNFNLYTLDTSRVKGVWRPNVYDRGLGNNQ